MDSRISKVRRREHKHTITTLHGFVVEFALVCLQCEHGRACFFSAPFFQPVKRTGRAGKRRRPPEESRADRALRHGALRHGLPLAVFESWFEDVGLRLPLVPRTGGKKVGHELLDGTGP